jgi:hypothetical protein
MKCCKVSCNQRLYSYNIMDIAVHTFALLVRQPLPLHAEVIKESTVQRFDVDVVVLEGSQNHYRRYWS